MDVRLIYIQGSKEAWLESAEALYLEKIQPYLKLEVIKVRSSKFERQDELKKTNDESESILRHIRPNDYLVLLDERGKTLSSIEFSKHLTTKWDSGIRNIVFVIGGAFGVSLAVKQRANLSLSLSAMVFNHHVARLVLLEQIYRAMMISKNKPYHNE